MQSAERNAQRLNGVLPVVLPQESASHTEFLQDARVLVERCLAGDDRAWQWFAERYWPVSARAARLALGQAYASYAADVAQEVFVVLLAKLPTWRGASHTSLGAWITSLARRRALNLRRSLRRRCAYWIPASPLIEQYARTSAGQDGNFRCELEALCAQLSQRQQCVLNELVEERSQVDIAGRLRISQSTVAREIAAIRAKWKRYE
jgi:RNA polymerase sigma factor (sigma-70 family)